MLKKISAVSVLFAVTVLSGCMSNQEKMAMEARLDALDDKANTAMRDASSAQIDANTALHVAIENQSKLK